MNENAIKPVPPAGSRAPRFYLRNAFRLRHRNIALRLERCHLAADIKALRDQREQNDQQS